MSRYYISQNRPALCLCPNLRVTLGQGQPGLVCSSSVTHFNGVAASKKETKRLLSFHLTESVFGSRALFPPDTQSFGGKALRSSSL